MLQLGGVDERTMHKYKQESAKTGKASFAYAWVLDDTQVYCHFNPLLLSKN